MSRVRLLVAALAAVVGAVVLVAAPAQAATVTVTGTVRDQLDSFRYANQTVRAFHEDFVEAWDTAVSGPDGRFTLTVPQGTTIRLGISFEYTGIDVDMRTATFVASADRVQDVYMPLLGSVSATVTDGYDGSEVTDATVTSMGAESEFTAPDGLLHEYLVGSDSCFSDAFNGCHVLALNRGRVTGFSVKQPGRPAETFPGIAVPTQITEHRLVLAPAPPISGVLRAHDGSALVGAKVTLPGSGSFSATTGSDGRWSLRSRTVPQRLQITGSVTENGWTVPYSFESAEFQHTAPRTIDLTLPAVENQRIQVLDSAGAPLTGVQVVGLGTLSTRTVGTAEGLPVTVRLAPEGQGTLGRSCAGTSADGICELPVLQGGDRGPVRVHLPLPLPVQEFPGLPHEPGAEQTRTVRVRGLAVALSAGSAAGQVRASVNAPADITALGATPVDLPLGMTSLVGRVDYTVALAPGARSGSFTLALPNGARPNAFVSLGEDGRVRSVSGIDGGTYGYSVTVVDGGPADLDRAVNGSVTGVLVPVVRDGLAVATTRLPAAVKGKPYTGVVTASGPVPPYTWALVGDGLPPGLTLSPEGVVSGTPTTLGEYRFPVRVTESSGSAAPVTEWVSLTVAPFVVMTTSVPDAFVGKSYSTSLKATVSGFVTWRLASGSLPPGFKLSSGGVLSGTATTTGSYSFDVTVSSSGKTSPAQRLTLVLKPMEVATSALPSAPVGATYSHTLLANGGKGTLVWSIADGSLPSGLTLSSGGTVSGRAGAVGFFPVTVRVSDASMPTKQVATRTLLLVVTPMEVATESVPDAKKGQYYQKTLLASGGLPTLSWAVIGGSLPSGLTLSSGGKITGYPKAVGTWTFQVRVQDASTPKNEAVRTLTLRVV